MMIIDAGPQVRAETRTIGEALRVIERQRVLENAKMETELSF
jgi:hypothetical protein